MEKKLAAWIKVKMKKCWQKWQRMDG